MAIDIHFLSNPAILLWGIYPRERKIYIYIKACRSIFIDLIHNILKVKTIHINTNKIQYCEYTHVTCIFFSLTENYVLKTLLGQVFLYLLAHFCFLFAFLITTLNCINQIYPIFFSRLPRLKDVLLLFLCL